VEIAGTRYLLKVHNGVESKDFETYKASRVKNITKAGHMTSVIHLQPPRCAVLESRGGIQNAVPLPHNKKRRHGTTIPKFRRRINASFCA
jgi:hypothetical protein